MLQLLKKADKIMCLFCKIAKKEIASNIILEDEEFIAFHDINPKAPVHILAIPKQHVDSFDEADSLLMGKISKFIQNVASEVKIQKSGYRVITNIGENGEQEVKHLHFHVLGGAKLKWDHFSDADPQGHF